MELKELIEKLDKCTPLECKGILYFTCGGISEYPGIWAIFADIVGHGIRANTWQRIEREIKK